MLYYDNMHMYGIYSQLAQYCAILCTQKYVLLPIIVTFLGWKISQLTSDQHVLASFWCICHSHVIYDHNALH